MRDALLRAAREFNTGRYFEAHEIIEEALEESGEDVWNLLVGLIQISVGYHKVTQGLWSGAASMLERGLEKLEPFTEGVVGLKLEQLRERARADMTALRDGSFDPQAFASRPPRMQFL